VKCGHVVLETRERQTDTQTHGHADHNTLLTYRRQRE